MNANRIVTVALAAIVMVAGKANAQDVSSFTDLSRVLELGQRVIVRQDDGRVSRGKVVAIDPDRIEVRWRRWLFAHGERTLTSTTVESIKVQDSDWNGTLLGAGTGILAGWLLVDKQCCRDFSIAPLGSYLGAWIGAGIGAAIDRSVNRVVYAPGDRTRFTLAPVVGVHRVGFTASAAF